MCEKEQKQKQAPVSGLPTNWAMDGTHIGGMQKLEFFALLVCMLLAIICGTFLYAVFVPANSSKPGSNGEQNTGHLHKEIEALRIQIGQMADEAKALKALEKHLQTIDELRAIVEKQQAKEKAEADILQKKLYNPKRIRWHDSNRNVQISRDGLKVENPKETWQHIYAEQGFDISGDSRKEDNFTGTIIFYFEVKQMKQTSPRGFQIGLSDGHIPADGDPVGDSPNSYGLLNAYYCLISGLKHAFEWPERATKFCPVELRAGNVVGCGLLLSPDHKLAIFFTFDGILFGKQIPISPTVHRLYPTVAMGIYMSVEANFGEDKAKPFSFELDKCPRLAFP